MHRNSLKYHIEHGHNPDGSLKAKSTPDTPIIKPDADGVYHCIVEGCNKPFGSRPGLMYHLKHGHLTPEELEQKEVVRLLCHHEGCDKSFKSRQGLNLHIATIHKPKAADGSPKAVSLFACPQPGCGKAFASKAGLSYHILKHPAPVGSV